MPERRSGPPETEATADPEPAGIPVRDLLRTAARGLGLRLLAGRSGLARRIDQARIQRPGLALAGYMDYLRPGHVQVFGRSELGYLGQLESRPRTAALRRLIRANVSCVVMTRGLAPPKELLQGADQAQLAVLTTRLDSSALDSRLSTYLQERLAIRTYLHAVLLEVFGLGVLITGESGIGKSESALDLVDRGHRLVADDVVEVRRVGDVLEGTSPELTRSHMELRGLGVINVKDLYGVSAIRVAKRLELVVALERWEQGKEYERLGLQSHKLKLLGIPLSLVRMPVAPGRNLALLVEVAARNHLLKEGGYDAARRLADRLDTLIASQARQGIRRGARRGP